MITTHKTMNIMRVIQYATPPHLITDGDPCKDFIKMRPNIIIKMGKIFLS